MSGAIDVKAIKNIDTYGGTTYWVKHERWPDEYRALCWFPKKSGGNCLNKAGWRTDHPGVGRCYYHRGHSTAAVAAKSIKNGRQAKVTRNSLKAKVDKFMEQDQDELFDLTRELSTLRVLFVDMVDQYDWLDEKQKGIHVRRMVELVSTIRNTVDSISKIQSRNALTAAHVAYLRATVADVLISWIDDPLKRERAVKDLASRIAGGEDDEKMVKLATKF